MEITVIRIMKTNQTKAFCQAYTDVADVTKQLLKCSINEKFHVPNICFEHSLTEILILHC